jgi:hypothetical protein
MHTATFKGPWFGNPIGITLFNKSVREPAEISDAGLGGAEFDLVGQLACTQPSCKEIAEIAFSNSRVGGRWREPCGRIRRTASRDGRSPVHVLEGHGPHQPGDLLRGGRGGGF